MSATSVKSSFTADDAKWGSNFWVTLADPQTNEVFYACPATGDTSWEPPEGHFVLPRSEAGEWWEIDDRDTGVPYYYHTKSGETSWEKPSGEFVIPLRMIQRLSAAYLPTRASMVDPDIHITDASKKTDGVERLTPPATPTAEGPSKDTRASSLRTRDSPVRSASRVAFAEPAVSVSVSPPTPNLRSRTAPSTPTTNGRATTSGSTGVRTRTTSNRPPVSGYPMPLSIDVDLGANGSANSRPAFSASASSGHRHSPVTSRDPRHGFPTSHGSPAPSPSPEKSQRTRTKSSTQPRTHIPPHHLAGREEDSLLAAAEMIARDKGTHSKTTHGTPSDAMPPIPFILANQAQPESPTSPAPPNLSEIYSNSKAAGSSTSLTNFLHSRKSRERSGTVGSTKSPGQPGPSPRPAFNGRAISSPILNPEATKRMAPVAAGGAAVFVDRKEPKKPMHGANASAKDGRMGFPQELKEDIQQFAGSDFAKRYFATHSTGLIFKRRVPIEQVMTWQRTPLTSPLLNLAQKSLYRDALKMFRAIQKVMGDLPSSSTGPTSLREEQRWLLSVCLLHGELRDEAYCQVVKQLLGNGNPQSVFQGWQLICVLLVTFPPSKDFESYLQSFLVRHTSQSEGRIDVMAKYCLKRLHIISRKGPRGRALTIPEIESASDAAFNPSTFGEPLDAIMRLQSRTYPNERVPIVLPFLADAILALGGSRTEGIFRVPGDGDAVAELKLRIDRGFYTLDGIEDPHVPASLLKLWLRELQTPLVPDEMYNECVAAGAANDSMGAVQLVARLPTHHRRVMVFAISFLQLFLEPKTTIITKMTAQNLALVMAPNLVRCASESVAIVFANAAHEQQFVYNLLLNLQCDSIDPDFRPTHGRGAVARGKQRTV
ncbi:hypothetical protein BKA62DRAFT_118752 [Auriculariales sp. MPI-PUGE-AT-0066]|nr:hypothetical protein BKA62DRAFT_118752 [Auriculariales sp. MPI-PUGE-AT-0066]